MLGLKRSITGFHQRFEVLLPQLLLLSFLLSVFPLQFFQLLLLVGLVSMPTLLPTASAAV